MQCSPIYWRMNPTLLDSRPFTGLAFQYTLWKLLFSTSSFGILSTTPNPSVLAWFSIFPPNPLHSVPQLPTPLVYFSSLGPRLSLTLCFSSLGSKSAITSCWLFLFNVLPLYARFYCCRFLNLSPSFGFCPLLATLSTVTRFNSLCTLHTPFFNISDSFRTAW